MLSHAALEVLELNPLWLSRPRRVEPQLTWLVRVLSGADGTVCWLVLEKCPVNEASVLLNNILLAFQLSVKQELEFVRAELAAAIQSEMPQWLWVCDDRLYQQVNPSDSDPFSCPVFLSVSPEQLLENGNAKSQLWANWCVWQINRAKRVPSHPEANPE